MKVMPDHPEFRHGRGGYARRCRCRVCLDAALAYNRDWSRRNKQRRAEYVRKSTLIRRYGITVDQHAELVEACGNLCYICGLPPNAASKNHNKLHIDHDHGSNVVRGLLCNQCNRAVGLMKENPARLRAAAEYLERHRRRKVAV